MDYNKNSMAGAYRCVLFAAAGDGDVSSEEVETSALASAGTEQWYEFSSHMKAAFSNALDGLFGDDSEEGEDQEEEEEEEEGLTLVPLEKEEIQEIAQDVLSNLDKCDGVSDIKAYASICASALPEDIAVHIVRQCFDVCGSDSADWIPDKKEIRNIKYLSSELNVDFKDIQKAYLDSLTWYEDDLLGDDLKVETIDKDFKDFEENSADAILRISVLAAYADGDFTATYSGIGDHWFLALCDIARSKGEKVVKIPEQVGEYIADMTNAAQAPLHEKTGDPYALMAEEEPNWDKIAKIKDKVPKYHAEVLANALESITEKSLHKITFKNATFMCAADDDHMTQHYTLDIFTGDQTKIDINDLEEQALQQIGEHFGFDEDQLLGLKTRLERGELGSIYSQD